MLAFWHRGLSARETQQFAFWSPFELGFLHWVGDTFAERATVL